MSDMSPSRPLRAILIELLGLALVLIAVPVMARIDLVVLENGLNEESLTEFTHNAVLAVGCLLFGLGARRHADKRGYLILVSAFLLALFIRENDALLDDLIQHGFWKYPSGLVLLGGGIAAYLNRATLRGPFLAHFETRSFAYCLVGLFIVVIYSRIFGSSIFLEDALGDGYNKAIKRIIQESAELQGYLILLFGAIVSSLHGFGPRR